MIKCTLPYCKRECLIKPNPLNSFVCLTKYAFNPVLGQSPNNFGSVWFEDGLYHLYYADFRNIYHSISKDGLSWKTGNSILFGEIGKWDEGLDCAVAFKDNDKWNILYRGHNFRNLPSHSIGLAYSYDGINWEKDLHNPVISPDKDKWDGEYLKMGLPTIFDPWGIIKVRDTYYLWFNSDNPLTCRSTGLAISEDLVNWEKDENNPIFKNGIFCVCPFKYNDNYYLIVTCGGYQRKHNWFELYRSKNPKFPERQVDTLGVILKCGNCGEFDYTYIDAPCILTNDIYRNSFPDGDIRLYYTGENGNRNWSHGLATFDRNSLI